LVISFIIFAVVAVFLLQLFSSLICEVQSFIWLFCWLSPLLRFIHWLLMSVLVAGCTVDQNLFCTPCVFKVHQIICQLSMPARGCIGSQSYTQKCETY